MKKRLLSLVLCLVMVFSLMPMAAFADAGPNNATNTISGFSVAGMDATYSNTSGNCTVSLVDGVSNSVDYNVKRKSGTSRQEILLLKNNYDKATLSFDFTIVNVHRSGDVYMSTNRNSSGSSIATTAARSGQTIHYGDITLTQDQCVRFDLKTNTGDSESDRTEIKLTNITLTQAPRAIVSVSQNTVSMTPNGGAKTVTVSSEGCSSVAVSNSNNSVATAALSNGVLTITPRALGNTTITLTGTADATHGGTPTVTVNVLVTDTPDDIQEGEIYSGGFVYTPKKTDGLKVGDDIDLSQTYYVNVGTESAPDFREVTISKDTYYTKELNDGSTGSTVMGWTPNTGDGMYYMKDAESAAVHNNFLLVQSETGTLQYSTYSNKLIASKSGAEADGMITGPSEFIGSWRTGSSTAYVLDENGVLRQVLYANKGSTFHYNMFIYYLDDQGSVHYLTEGANEHDGISKYGSDSDTPVGVGNDYYTYNNTLGSYGGKGYYTGTYYKVNPHTGKTVLYFMDGNTQKWLSRSGVVDSRSAASVAEHDGYVVYTGPLYRLQTLQRATYFTYAGAAAAGQPQNVTSRLSGDVLTGLPLYTRRVSGEAEIVDNDPDDVAGGGDFGVLVDTTNNFKGNLFIQKKLYRDDSTGTYNIKLESWATGNMSQTEGGGPMDVILVVDLSHSMEEDGSNFLINGQHRIVYVRQAIQDFINTMYEANQAGGDIRLAITSFSNLASSNDSNVKKYPLGVYNGSTFTQMRNCNSTTYKNALKKVDAAGKTDLLASLQTDPFQDPQGNGTYPEDGMKLAINILQNRDTANQNRKPIIVFFTDGWTGTDTQSASKYAELALTQTNILKKPKAQGGYDATIYSIGVFHFDDADPNQMYYQYDTDDPNITVKNYMEHMSSMYNSTQMEVITTKLNGQPRTDGAHRITNNTPDNTDQTYYYRIRTGTGSTNPLQELNDAFSQIAETIAETDVPVDTTSILRDVINQNDFALPANTSGTVTAKVVPAKSINSLKQIEWDYDHETTASGVTITPSTESGNQLKSVDVKGYDYQANFSAPATATAEAKKGNKLVVRIKGLMPKHGGEVYSNSDAGIYNLIEGSATEYEEYLPVESPFDFIDSRSYVVDFNADMKFAENGLLVSGADKYVTQIRTNSKTVPGQYNGAFSKDSGNTVSYQLMKDAIANGGQSAYEDYTFTGKDTALVFGAYYANDTRAESGKTTGSITTKQMVNSEKVDQTVAKAWQVVNMVPASSIYYDDDLANVEAVIGDGSGYNSAVSATPDGEKTTGWTFAFTGTGIDIYCTTDPQSGYAQAKLDGSQTQTIKNYDKTTTRYNVPSFSFRGLDYGKHSVTINILSTSHYKFDGVRIYGSEEDQAIYEDTSEQFAAYINMREALLNDNHKDSQETFEIQNEAAISGALFVDDNSKLVQLVTATDEQIAAGEGIVDVDGVSMINVYANEFEAYQANSPKQEIYLSNGQSLVFQLTADAEAAAQNGNLWIGLSAPDAGSNTGTVTLKAGKTTSVTSGVDMYYPITGDMIGANRVVTIENTGSSMISVTNLKITGNQDIFNAINAPGATTESVSEDAAVLSVSDAVSMVFEPVSMQTVKIAANHGVDPDAPAEPDPTPTPGIVELVRQLISTFVSTLFQSIARLFNH